MGSIRLYRTFYCVNVIKSGSTTVDTYTLLDPISLSANTFIAGTSTSPIEVALPITQESSGVYYTDLNPILYTSDNTYDLVWYTQYISVALIKKLITRFRINAVNIGSNVDIEVTSSDITIEI
jgi:hypothetical protein